MSRVFCVSGSNRAIGLAAPAWLAFRLEPYNTAPGVSYLSHPTTSATFEPFYSAIGVLNSSYAIIAPLEFRIRIIIERERLSVHIWTILFIAWFAFWIRALLAGLLFRNEINGPISDTESRSPTMTSRARVVPQLTRNVENHPVGLGIENKNNNGSNILIALIITKVNWANLTCSTGLFDLWVTLNYTYRTLVCVWKFDFEGYCT